MRTSYATPLHAGMAGFWPTRARVPTTQTAVRVGLVGGLVVGVIGLCLSGRRTSRFPPLYSAPPPLDQEARR